MKVEYSKEGMDLPTSRIIALLTCFAAGLCSGCTGSAPATRDAFYFPGLTAPVKEEALLLAIDDHLLPIKRNLSLYYSKPKVRLKPVLTPSRDDPNKPDYISNHFYGTVLHDEGKFRMCYYGVGKLETEQRILLGPTCYAESKDGIEWMKPSLNQVEYKGSRDNNAFDLPGEQMYGGHVIKDEEEPDPQRRYKMIYNLHNGTTVGVSFRYQSGRDQLGGEPEGFCRQVHRDLRLLQTGRDVLRARTGQRPQ